MFRARISHYDLKVTIISTKLIEKHENVQRNLLKSPINHMLFQ